MAGPAVGPAMVFAVPAWPLVAAALLQAPVAPASPSPAPSPEAPAQAPAAVDPAAATFETGVGLLLVLVKPDRTADYEAAMAALQGALSATTDPSRRALAQGWRVFRASETDAKGNAVYVHALFPTVPGADYRPSLLLDELLTDLPDGLIDRYADALAAPPTRLSLAEVANMAIAPVKK